MDQKYNIIQQRKQERLEIAEDLLSEALLQLEYLDKKFASTGTTANLKSRIDTFLQTTIGPICTHLDCTNECLSIKEKNSIAFFYRKTTGKQKERKIIGYEKYCFKHFNLNV